MSNSEILPNGSQAIEATEQIPTPLSFDNVGVIKSNIRKAWERVKNTRGFTQANLATALGLSQGAVSKLLSNDHSHPWTIEKIVQFSQFCKVPIEDIIDSDSPLINFFIGWTGDRMSPNPGLVDESFSALERYFRNRGKPVSKARLETLAGMVAVRVAKTERSAADFDRVIMDVIIDEAGKGT